MSNDLEIRLSEREKALLVGTVNSDWYPDWYYPFAAIAEITETPRADVRRIVRSLARKGIMQFASGLSTEDGDFLGSGYALTEKGVEIAEAIAAALRAALGKEPL